MCQKYKSEKGFIYGDKCHFRHVQAEAKFGENIHKLKNSDKAAFYTPVEKGMLEPTSPEEREFV